MGPQSLQFDARGLLWFTAAAAGQIGRLDPATGVIQTWPIPPPRTGFPSSPFSLTVMANGQVWFGDITGGAVGHLDPATGHVTHNGDVWFANNGASALVRYAPGNATYTFFKLSTLSAGLYGLTLDPAGALWFTASGSSTNYVGEMNP